jgi:hypothetical protein
MALPLINQVEQLEVLVTSLKGKDVREVGTLGKLLTPMIDDASEIYERLHQLKLGDRVIINFKFVTSNEETNGNAEEVGGDKDGGTESSKEETNGDTEEVGGDKDGGTECEYVISVLCQHVHPYLDHKIYIASRGNMDSTFLKGKNCFLLVMWLQEMYS